MEKTVIAILISRYEGKPPNLPPLLPGLDRRKYRPICIYLKATPPGPNFFHKKNCKAFYISKQKFFRVFNFAAIWKLSRILKKEKVTILHCHRHQATVYGTIAAAFAGTPVVFAHVHGLNRSISLRRKFINFLISKKISRIITAGKTVRQEVIRQFPGIGPEKVVALDNSIDYTRFAEPGISKVHARKRLELPLDGFIFGTVGRFAPTKGYTYLIDAFAKVKRHVPNAHLIFVGRGRQENEIRAQAQQAGIYDSVTFLGRRDDIPQVLRAFDVFVFPSIAEGMPYAVLEAMAAGLAVIASAVGGIPDVLDNGELGIVIPPKDKNALAEAMIELVKMPEKKRQKLIDNAKQKVYSCYSHRVIIKNLENIYETEVTRCYESNRRQKSNV